VDEFEVRLMCEVLEVSPSGYYASRKRSPCARAIADERLLLNVRIAHEQSGRTYGAPRVQRELKDDGIDVGTKRVARLMREDGLVGRAPRRKRPLTTDSAHAHPIAPNLLERQFDVNGVTLNQVWVSDITYVPTRAGWLYLATVLDLASRRVVGWAMRDTIDAELTVSALAMAIALRRPSPGLIHHSDRGSQYACADYQTVLATHGMIASMSRKGNCWDNAVAESFFATIKRELISDRAWPTRAGLHRAVFDYIEGWYNTRRLHSSLGYRSPAEYESTHHNAARQAA
jgi:transposase InsO family protein